MKKELAKLKESSSEINKQHDVLRRRYDEDIEKWKQLSEDEKVNSNEHIRDLESKLKLTEEQFEVTKQKWDKDLAIFKQKQEFLELQLRDEKLKNEEQKQ